MQGGEALFLLSYGTHREACPASPGPGFSDSGALSCCTLLSRSPTSPAWGGALLYRVRRWRLRFGHVLCPDTCLGPGDGWLHLASGREYVEWAWIRLDRPLPVSCTSRWKKLQRPEEQGLRGCWWGSGVVGYVHLRIPVRPSISLWPPSKRCRTQVK